MKQFISVEEVVLFKWSCCNENLIIAEIIKNQIQEDFCSIILDVGCGTGDIAHWALKDKIVIGIDVNYADPSRYPLSQGHERLKVGFFEYSPTRKISTLFISHTLQFLDEDLDRLNKKVVELNPNKVICVLNRNDDFLGELIVWSNSVFEVSNPEVRHDDFPDGYKLIRSIPFVANLSCMSFEEMIQQISYLLLVETKGHEEEILTFLKERLDKPEFTINQDILIYGKE